MVYTVNKRRDLADFWKNHPGTEPMAMRVWHANAGHQVVAKALQVADGKVQLERADGSKIMVELENLAAPDQADLRKHFGLAETPATGTQVAAVATGAPADDLPYPHGKATAEISCDDEFSSFTGFAAAIALSDSRSI